MERATEIEVLPDYVDPDPGVYVARSNTQAYAALLAMVAAGDAQLLGERYDRDGKRQVAVSIGKSLRQNRGTEVVGYLFDVESEHSFSPNQQQKGQIRIGAQFYAAALKDYSHEWPERWWREAVQNSVDAGAREMKCVTRQLDDGNWEITADDDGRGMDRETLLDKFLVLGGTTKVAGGTTGGFGKAKELLVLPWISWEVHTRDVIVRGAGIDYDVIEAPYREGTRLTVVMPGDKHTSGADAMGFIKKCNIPRVHFTVNGEAVKADLKVGRPVESFGDLAEIYYDPKNDDYPYYMLVRTNGLFMFSEWLHNKPRGLIVMELLKPSVELLTANRDGLADRQLKDSVNRFAGKLAIEAKEVLRQKEKRIRKKFRGTGKFEIDENRLRAAMFERLGTMEPQGDKLGRGEHSLSAQQIAGLVDILRDVTPVEETVYTDEAGEPLAGKASFRIDPELAGQMMAGLALSGPSQVEIAVKQLAWEPDFYVVNEIPGYNIPKKFFPESMTANVRKLASYWAELCRFVLIQLSCGKSYGVGFLFYPEHQAEYAPEGDEDWLMLNPFHGSNPETDEMFDLSDDGDLARLFSLAVHECTHMAYNVSEHNQDFASALTQAIAKTYGKDKQVRAIKRMVLAQQKEVTEKLKAAKPPRSPSVRTKKGSRQREVSFMPPQSGSEPFVAMTGGAPYEHIAEGPEWYGDFKGVKLFDPDARTHRWEIADMLHGELFRLDPSAQGSHEPDLLDVMRQAWGSRDPYEFMRERSQEYAKIGDTYLRKVLEGRWQHPVGLPE